MKFRSTEEGQIMYFPGVAKIGGSRGMCGQAGGSTTLMIWQSQGDLWKEGRK